MAAALPSTEALKHILLTCKKQKDLTHALLLGVYMLNLGLDTHALMDNYIPSSLTQLGSLAHNGHQVWNRLMLPPANSWGSLVISHVNVGQPHHALTLYQHMLKSGSVCPDGRTFVALLNACAKLKHLEKGLELHFHVDKLGLLGMDIFVGSALVDMYCKCGVLNNAQQVFDQLPCRNIVLWNSLMAGYAENGHGKLALMSYEQMQVEGFSPNAVTFVSSLKLCGSMKDIELGWKLHANIEQQGSPLVNRFVGSALVDMYVKCEMLPSAQQVFDRLLVRDVVTWTALIGGYVENGEAEEALECVKRMQFQGVCPNAFTFVCSLRACNIIGEIKKIQEIHAETERMGLLEGNVHIVSVLMDIYAGCGFLARANEVFKRLPARDLVTWTTLIAGHVEHGLAEEALKCFDQMQLEGVAADARTFVCSLKACGLSKEISKGTEIHSEIERKGLIEKDLVIGNALVDMYARCDLLNKAKEVFDQLAIKDAISWNSMMAAYSERGQSEEVFQCYSQMLLEGTPPDDVSIIFCLKACGAIQDIRIGSELHVEIERNGYFEKNHSVGGTLVDMYSKCGALATAQKVFDQLLVRDIISWNTLIAGYVSQARGEEALRCFERMQSEGIYPDEVTLISSLKACGQSGNICKGLEIHADIKRKMLLEQHPAIGGALVDMYFKCGLIVKAQETFDKLLIRDLAAWNVLILGYADQGLGEEALKFFEQMQLEGVPLDAPSSMCSLKSSRCPGIVDTGAVIYAEFVRTEMAERGPIIGLMLVGIYLKKGALAKAQQMFDNLPIRNSASWSALIAGYAEHGKGESSLQCFDQMLIEGVIPDSDTLLVSLKACGCSRATERGYEIHAEIEKRGVQGDLFVGSALVDMYAKCGLLTTARAVFDKLSVRDVVSWNALMAGYAEHDHNKEALNLMTYMQLEKVSPSAPTFVFSLKACGNMGFADKVKELHDIIEKQGLLASDLVVGNSLVDVYSKCGLISTAQKVFDKLSIRDIASWNSLIFGYKQHGDSEDVFRVFDQLMGEGARPDPVTFIIVLNACSRACLVDRSENYFNSMVTCHGICPMFEHHSCIIDLLCRAGELGKAISLMRTTSFCQKLVAWRTVLNACKNWGNLQDGQVAFEHAVHLDKGDAATYVLMAHTYASNTMAAGL